MNFPLFLCGVANALAVIFGAWIGEAAWVITLNLVVCVACLMAASIWKRAI